MTREWYFQAMGQEIGPLSAAEIKVKVANGQIQPDTLIRKGTEGKWVFGGLVKGLFPTAPEKPVEPVAVPLTAAPKPPAPLSPINGSPPEHTTTPPSAFVALAEDETESHPPSVEFYNFVGFREAISPVLHDAVKQFALERGMTISQVDRQALARFIQRPELASDLFISAVAALPQPVNEKSNQNGHSPLSDRDKTEIATFRFTLFNSSPETFHVSEAAFLPENLEKRTYDTVSKGQHSRLDHAGHVPVRLSPLVIGQPIRFALDVSIPPQGTKDVVLWFYDQSKPSLIKTRGQLVVGEGENLALSEFFTIVLHGDSPSP